MEKRFCTPISAVAVHPVEHNVIAIAFFNGLFKCCMLDLLGKKLKLVSVWASKLKKSIRGLEFSDDGAMLFVICENKALCVYDVKSGRRLRCISRSHDDSKPHQLISLPNSNYYQLATGSDNGEVKLWDMNTDNPVVATFTEQEDSINAFSIYKSCLLSASSDSTFCSYDFRQRRLRVKSELMHSELHSISVIKKFTCVGAGDGHIEIFKNGEYGNILERIESIFLMGVETMVEVKPNVLLLGGSMNDELRFYHIHPHKKLQGISHFGGADILLMTKDSKYLIVCSTYSDVFKVIKMTKVLDMIGSADSAVNLFAEKANAKRKDGNSAQNSKSSFFKDLLPEEDDENDFFYDDNENLRSEDEDEDEELEKDKRDVSENNESNAV